MKTKTLILILFLHPWFIASAYAEHVWAPRRFEFGLMYHHFDYKEDIPGSGKSTVEGWLPGSYIGYSYNQKENLYAKGFVEFSTGDLTYDGTTLGGTPISFSDNPQELFRFEVDFGYTFDAGKDYSFIPYVGYGHRYWYRGKKKITPTYISYREDYTWHYIPLGIKTDIRLNDQWAIEPNVAFRIMFAGELKALASKFDPGLNDPKFNLGNKTGWLIEVPFRYNFSRDWWFMITPWYEHSEIGESDTSALIYNGTVIDYYIEPDSETDQYGFSFGLTYFH